MKVRDIFKNKAHKMATRRMEPVEPQYEMAQAIVDTLQEAREKHEIDDYACKIERKRIFINIHGRHCDNRRVMSGRRLKTHREQPDFMIRIVEHEKGVKIHLSNGDRTDMKKIELIKMIMPPVDEGTRRQQCWWTFPDCKDIEKTKEFTTKLALLITTHQTLWNIEGEPNPPLVP